MENKKIKVVWVCSVSNAEIRKHLAFKNDILSRTFNSNPNFDLAQWNTNAINEFKNFDDIELHIVSKHKHLKYNLTEFVEGDIHYHIFKSEDDYNLFKLKRKFFKKRYTLLEYKRNTETICSLIDRINPDIVHFIGAELQHTSSAAPAVDRKYPLLISLQTLVNNPQFFKNYTYSEKSYKYISNIEKNTLKRADYICTNVELFKNIILEKIKPDAKFLNMKLAIGEKILEHKTPKEYTFVYFALNISKAADWAIEAFALAQKEFPEITLNIIGGYNQQFKEALDKRIEELDIKDNIIFSGSQPTHDDVIRQVRKAKFAVLPLKIDLITGTIREAIANGLPVVTTITPGTPKLNVKRETLILSEKGDFKAMADNMIKLLSDEDFVNQIKENIKLTVDEMYNNTAAMDEWRKQYYNIKETWGKIKE